MMLSSLYRRAFLLAAVVGLAIMSASAARAFTVEDKGGGGGGKGFTDLDISKVPDPDAPASGFSSKDGVAKFKTDYGTFQFGSRPSFDQRYNSNSLFDPMARDGR